MEKLNELSDEDFVPFLHSLGVETYKKSFEWILSDSAYSGLFTWLYSNLDHNNALNAREKYRYEELFKKGQLLSPEELELSLLSIQQEYPGICLPGDNEGFDDMKLDISMQKEKLQALEKEERILKELINQNELIKDQLNIETTKLHATQQQLREDESVAAQECLALAEEVENLTDGVVDVIADALDVYANCHTDKELSKKFVAFGPLEAYRQSQALFRSHFDLYASRRFGKRQHVNYADEELRTAVVEAKNLEERLSDAASAYIDSKAVLSGEQAKLALVANYNNVHPSQISSITLETQLALELLNQEETILEQQIRDAVKDLVKRRTKMAVDTATAAALAVREQIHSDLSQLLSTCEQALSLDRVVYGALRLELRALLECVHFATQLHDHVRADTAAGATRIQAMTEIISDQEASTKRLHQTDVLLHALCAALGTEPTGDVMLLPKLYGDLLNRIKQLKEDVKEGYRMKERSIDDYKASLSPLRTYIYSSCTRQPTTRPRDTIKLSHSLTSELERCENTVLHVGILFASVKNGDKNNLRKLWQWFLTDPPRLIAACKGIQT